MKKYKIISIFVAIGFVLLGVYYFLIQYDTVPKEPMGQIRLTAEYLDTNPMPTPSGFVSVLGYELVSVTSDRLCLTIDDTELPLPHHPFLPSSGMTYLIVINGEHRAYSRHSVNFVTAQVCVDISDLYSGLHLGELILGGSRETISSYQFSFQKPEK